jgi:hypothetical protein
VLHSFVFGEIFDKFFEVVGPYLSHIGLDDGFGGAKFVLVFLVVSPALDGGA